MNISEISGFINSLLNEGHEVRIKNDWNTYNTVIRSDGNVVAELSRIMLYPGYLNVTKAGTPSRIICLEDRGGFGREDIQDVETWLCCMSHTYNDHDRENWFNPDEGGEDRFLDQSYEKEDFRI